MPVDGDASEQRRNRLYDPTCSERRAVMLVPRWRRLPCTDRLEPPPAGLA